VLDDDFKLTVADVEENESKQAKAVAEDTLLDRTRLP